MIKIQGITIDEDAITEGLARLVDDLTDPACSPDHNAEKLFGLMTMIQQANDNDKGVIVERVQYFAYLNTDEGMQAIKTMSKTILNS
jgi:hypothetical protein